MRYRHAAVKRLSHAQSHARVAELADAQDLGSCPVRGPGSTPGSRSDRNNLLYKVLCFLASVRFGFTQETHPVPQLAKNAVQELKNAVPVGPGTCNATTTTPIADTGNVYSLKLYSCLRVNLDKYL